MVLPVPTGQAQPEPYTTQVHNTTAPGRKEEGIMDKGEIFCKLVHMATEKGIAVKFVPFKVYDGRIKGNKIGIRQGLRMIDEYNYNLAHELAHAYLHYDKGSILPDMEDKELHKQYEEQADRAAKMLLAALSVGQKGGAE